MKLVESTKNKKTKDENDQSLPHLEITEVILVHCNNDYQHDAIVMHTFVSNNLGQLLDVSPKYLIF